DATYVSREMEFDAPAPFDDANVINVINGIVKTGEIPRGARPTREISAAQNYGFALGIMRRPNNRLLDLSACRPAQAMAAWIERRLGDSGEALPVTAVYKNFMGIGGTDGMNWGLSKRMVQLYLLCLAREGKVRIWLSGRNLPAETIDYSNMAEMDFRAAVLDAFDRVQRLKPPEGWELLAPYAAVILDDPTVRDAGQDAEIQTSLSRLLRHRQDMLPRLRELNAGLDVLFEDIGRPNPLRERLNAWEAFLAAPVPASDPLPHLLAALDAAFGYRVHAEQSVQQEELDDLTARCAEVKQAELLHRHRDRLRAAARYAACPLPDDPALAGIRATLNRVAAALDRLDELMANETRLHGELLDPATDAIGSYTVRYLQALDQVAAAAEEARGVIAALPETPDYRALARLATLPQLGADPRPELQAHYRGLVEGPGLFPAGVTRATVERALRERPDPDGCPLTLNNAGAWLTRAEEAVCRGRELTRAALLEKARLLHSPMLRERLAQGAGDPFIAGLLAAPSPEEMADYLAQTIGAADDAPAAAAIEALARYLKKLRVRRLRAQEKPLQQLEEAALDLFTFGRVRPLDEQLARLDAVSADAVRALFERLL
ncbi:MAG: hypothetical protein WHX53_03065, partial [Anaerolineae bacterium]